MRFMTLPFPRDEFDQRRIRLLHFRWGRLGLLGFDPCLVSLGELRKRQGEQTLIAFSFDGDLAISRADEFSFDALAPIDSCPRASFRQGDLTDDEPE